MNLRVWFNGGRRPIPGLAKRCTLFAIGYTSKGATVGVKRETSSVATTPATLAPSVPPGLSASELGINNAEIGQQGEVRLGDSSPFPIRLEESK